MKVLKSRIVLRNLVFLVVVCAAYPVYSGELNIIVPCDDIEISNSAGVPNAQCTGYGHCTSDSLYGIVLLTMNAHEGCPNQPVLNLVSVSGVYGADTLNGIANAFAETGQLIGFRIVQQGCSGFFSDTGEVEFPLNCFKPPYGEEFPLPPPGTVASCPVTCIPQIESGCATAFDDCMYPGSDALTDSGRGVAAGAQAAAAVRHQS